jgi:hypothetical protein
VEACPPFRMRLPMDGWHGARCAFCPRYGVNFKQPGRHCERSEAIHLTAERMGCFVAFAPRNDGEHSFAISPQVCARLILNFSPSEDQRAQGMPGARCARSLACKN